MLLNWVTEFRPKESYFQRQLDNTGIHLVSAYVGEWHNIAVRQQPDVSIKEAQISVEQKLRAILDTLQTCFGIEIRQPGIFLTGRRRLGNIASTA